MSSLVEIDLVVLKIVKAWPFIWINLNPLHPRMLCAKFGWNWPSGSKEDFLILSIYFRYFVIISHWTLGKGRVLWTPLSQECFVPSLVEIGPVVLKKKMKMWKVYDNANNDNGQILIRKAHLSLWFRWANLYPRMFYAKFCWNWPNNLKERIFKYFQYF